MGEAKRRGTREQRRAQAIERNRIEWEQREAEARERAKVREAAMQTAPSPKGWPRAGAVPLMLFSGLALAADLKEKP